MLKGSRCWRPCPQPGWPSSTYHHSVCLLRHWHQVQVFPRADLQAQENTRITSRRVLSGDIMLHTSLPYLHLYLKAAGVFRSSSASGGLFAQIHIVVPDLSLRAGFAAGRPAAASHHTEQPAYWPGAGVVFCLTPRLGALCDLLSWPHIKEVRANVFCGSL